ncbi:MAG: type II toxin-antitoxin system RelE/ParE family toxin [Candidatus Micrarchaeota archaeon]|nr:type II toxin-antitoxin system RelE/ParE family toxin [Candidatus Micrarchaeota archaeon]
MVKNVVVTADFGRAVKKLRDSAVKERVKRQIAEIIERPDIGKPLRFQQKGERTVRVPPFRIIYAVQGDTIYFLCFEKRDVVYR